MGQIGIYMLMFILGVTATLSVFGLIAVRDWYRAKHPVEEKAEKKSETKKATEAA